MKTILFSIILLITSKMAAQIKIEEGNSVDLLQNAPTSEICVGQNKLKKMDSYGRHLTLTNTGSQKAIVKRVYTNATPWITIEFNDQLDLMPGQTVLVKYTIKGGTWTIFQDSITIESNSETQNITIKGAAVEKNDSCNSMPPSTTGDGGDGFLPNKKPKYQGNM